MAHTYVKVGGKFVAPSSSSSTSTSSGSGGTSDSAAPQYSPSSGYGTVEGGYTFTTSGWVKTPSSSGGDGGGSFSRGTFQSTPTETTSFITSGGTTTTTTSTSRGGGGGSSTQPSKQEVFFTTVPTAREEALRQSLPPGEREKPPQTLAEKRTGFQSIGDFIFGRERETLGEKFTKEQLRKAREEEQAFLTAEQTRFQDLVGGTGAFEQQQFDFFQSQVDRGELTVEQAQKRFESSVSGFRKGEISKFESGLKERGGFLGGMSTPEGEQFLIFAPQKEIKGLTLFGKPSKEEEEFFAQLKGKERFQAQLSSAFLSTGKLASEVVGVGGFIGGVGIETTKRIRDVESRGESVIPAGTAGFKGARGFAEQQLGIEGRQEDVFGIAATTLPFVPGAVALGIRGVKGGAGVVQLIRAEGLRGAGIAGRDVSLAFSPIKPARAGTSIEGAKTIQIVDETVSRGRIERRIVGGFVDRDVSFRTFQVLTPTKGGGLTGASITETTTPRFKGGADAIFGGTKTEFSLGIQNIPPRTFPIQKQIRDPVLERLGGFAVKEAETLRGAESFNIQARLGTITERAPGVFKADIAVKPEPIFSRQLGTGVARGTGEGREVFVGVGGKAIGQADIFRAEDLIFGRRRFVADDVVRVFRPAGIKKTPLSKTFQETVTEQVLEPRALPPPPKPSSLKVIETGKGDGISGVVSGGGIGLRSIMVDQSFGFTGDFALGFRETLQTQEARQRGAVSTGRAVLEPQEPRIIFGQSGQVFFPIQTERQFISPAVLGLQGVRAAQDVAVIPRQAEGQFVAVIPRQAEGQLVIPRQAEKLMTKQVEKLEPFIPRTPFPITPFRPLPGRGFIPPLIPPIRLFGTGFRKPQGAFPPFRYQPSITGLTLGLKGRPGFVGGGLDPFTLRGIGTKVIRTRLSKAPRKRKMKRR